MSSYPSLDAIVVGGGLSGGLCALALQASGFSVALIDGQAPVRMTEEAFDGRTTAIAYASARVFRRLGLWSAIEEAAEPIRDILVTDGRCDGRFRAGRVAPSYLRFDGRELARGSESEHPLGWIVENRVLRRAIYDRLAKAPQISLRAPARQTGASFGDNAAVSLDDGETLTARLVIAADGKQSSLRGEAGLRTSKWSYPQTGIVATIGHERPHRGVAQEFFLPSGPFAILPMTQNRSSLVWTERSAAAPAYMALDDDAFLAEIASRAGPYLGELTLAGPRWSYPLSFQLAERFFAPRLALIGDAARAIHPIAGQGYNLGVKDIAALADVLTTARELGEDIGAPGVLERYDRWRRFDSTMLALGTDALNRLFSNDMAAVRFARDFGMGAVNRVAALRRFFMRQAGADLGDLPTLMQPGV